MVLLADTAGHRWSCGHLHHIPAVDHMLCNRTSVLWLNASIQSAESVQIGPTRYPTCIAVRSHGPAPSMTCHPGRRWTIFRSRTDTVTFVCLAPQENAKGPIQVREDSKAMVVAVVWARPLSVLGEGTVS